MTSLVTAALVGRAYAAIGPVTDLTISNAAISPDGFTRDAVVMNGVFPGPLITGNKVSQLSQVSSTWKPFCSRGTRNRAIASSSMWSTT